MMERTLGRPPRSFVKSCKPTFYTTTNGQTNLNWSEDDDNYVKQNCKPLHRWNTKPSNADHQSFFNLLDLMLNYQFEKRPSAKTCMRHHFYDEEEPIIIMRSRKTSRNSVGSHEILARTISDSSNTYPFI